MAHSEAPGGPRDLPVGHLFNRRSRSRNRGVSPILRDFIQLANRPVTSLEGRESHQAPRSASDDDESNPLTTLSTLVADPAAVPEFNALTYLGPPQESRSRDGRPTQLEILPEEEKYLYVPANRLSMNKQLRCRYQSGQVLRDYSRCRSYFLKGAIHAHPQSFNSQSRSYPDTSYHHG